MPLTSALLPIDTNDEMPAPPAWASAAMAIPTPPDCEAMAIPPGTERLAGERGVQPARGRDDAEAVRPDEAHAVAAGGGEQLVLQAAPSAPSLGEPGRDDHGGRDAGGATTVDDVGHRRCGHGDDGEIGHVVELVELGHGVDPADRRRPSDARR